MFTAALAALVSFKGLDNITIEDKQNLHNDFKCMKSGFTKSPHNKKSRNRRRYQIAFESRRRNRK
jgi:hypothetical protein